MNQEKASGWGAYQNKKKEIEKLKKQIVVQEINSYGDIISLDEKNNFKPVFTNINPFRFPNKIKNEEIIELVIKENEKTETLKVETISKQAQLEDNVLEKEDISKEINNYKLKISKNTIIIDNLINENKHNKQELDDKIKELTKNYNIGLSLNNEKICKLQKYNNTIEDMIKIKINLLEIERDIISDNNGDDDKNDNDDNNGDDDKNDNDDNNGDDDKNDNDDNEGLPNYCETVRVPDECSIINIMKNAFSKQKETKTHNSVLFSIAWDTIESSGYLYISTDLGVSWSKQTSLGFEKWYSLASSNDGTKIIVANGNGYLYTSTDSGMSWIEQTKLGTIYWTSLSSSADGTKLIAVTTYGDGLYTSTDSGVSWIRQKSVGLKGWSSVSCSSDGTIIIAAARNDSLYISSDSGVSWIQQTPEEDRKWHAVVCSNF
jgi:hypothetical protein